MTVEEPALSRDHTERMLASFGARLAIEPRRVTITPGAELRGQPTAVPGDLSSAAFFLVAGSVVAESELTIANVGVNPTRAGLLDVLDEMGADVVAVASGTSAGHAGRGPAEGGEPAADLRVRRAALRGAEVGGELVPRLIDEVPVLAVAACAAAGVTRIRDAAELRVKESDRIRAIATELGRMGADIAERPDGLEIRGGPRLRGAAVTSAGDHRIAMALIVAGLAADGPTVVDDTECIATSYPGFLQALNALAGHPCAAELP